MKMHMEFRDTEPNSFIEKNCFIVWRGKRIECIVNEHEIPHNDSIYSPLVYTSFPICYEEKIVFEINIMLNDFFGSCFTNCKF